MVKEIPWRNANIALDNSESMNRIREVLHEARRYKDGRMILTPEMWDEIWQITGNVMTHEMMRFRFKEKV